jgi:hypothetical protein
MPVTRPSERLQPEVKGSFAFEPASLGFTNVRTSRTLTLRTDHPQPQELVVHRKSHVEYRSTGRVQVTDEGDTPLQWLRFGGCDEVLANGDCRVRLEARSSRDITVSEAANPVLPRWDGMLAVQSATMGNQDVEVSYASRPDGAWSGSMFYFASFRDKGLAEWVAGTGAINDVENALVQRWAKLKTGQISLDEFNAAIASTVNESWRWPLLKQYPACAPAEVACYPYDNAQGYSVYTPTSRRRDPHGHRGFPVSLNLHQPDPAGAPELLTGRIVTARRCTTWATGASPCAWTRTRPVHGQRAGVVLCGVRELSAEVLVGGRYAVASLDPSELSACKLYGGGSYDLVKTPWLVPGFRPAPRWRTAGATSWIAATGCCRTARGRARTSPGALRLEPHPRRPHPRPARQPRGRALVNATSCSCCSRSTSILHGRRRRRGLRRLRIMRLARVTRDSGRRPPGVHGPGDRSFADDKLGCSAARAPGELEGSSGRACTSTRTAPPTCRPLADVLIEARTATRPNPAHRGRGGPRRLRDTGLVTTWPGARGRPRWSPAPRQRGALLHLKRASATWPGRARGTPSPATGLRLGPEGIESGIATEGTGASLKLTDTFQQTVSVDVVSPGGCWDAVQRWAAVGQATLGGATFEVRLDPMWPARPDPAAVQRGPP